jgi:hypothetical protein
MQRNRDELKAFFKKGAFPTESNFADLIDSALLQQEDKLLKPPNDPLTLRAIGDDERMLLLAAGRKRRSDDLAVFPEAGGGGGVGTGDR